MENWTIKKFTTKLLKERFLRSFNPKSYFKLYLGAILLKIGIFLKLDRLFSFVYRKEVSK